MDLHPPPPPPPHVIGRWTGAQGEPACFFSHTYKNAELIEAEWRIYLSVNYAIVG